MHHERLFALAGQRVDDLRVAAGAERRRDERLRLAAREQRRAVRAGQHSGLHRDLAHRLHVAPVDARLAGENAAADDVVFETTDLVGYLARVELRGVARSQRGHGSLLDLADAGVARLLLGDAVGLAEVGLGLRRHCCDERRVLCRRRPVPRRLAGFGREFLDRLDRDLHLLVPEDDRAEHDFLGEHLRLGLDHQHRVGRAGHDEVELRSLERAERRIEHVLPVHVTDTRRADRSLERDSRQRQRGGRAKHRGNVGVDLRIERDDGRYDLHLVVEAFREQRANRPVDQARGESLLFRRTAFTLEEAARDAARGVGLLDVVDGEREEILVRVGVLAPDGGDEDDGVAHRNEDGAIGLARKAAGLDGD
jgi:hypothetical protein